MKIWVKLNKNFANFPLARDPRRGQAGEWRRGHKREDGCLKQWWWRTLPGERKIVLRLPHSFEGKRRCPTAFDMNVLFLVLSKAQATNSNKVEFASHAAMLAALGVGRRQSRNRQRLHRVAAALERLSLIFRECWYRPKQHPTLYCGQVTPGRPAEKGQSIGLPPPFKECDISPSGKISITLSKAWFPHLGGDAGFRTGFSAGATPHGTCSATAPIAPRQQRRG